VKRVVKIGGRAQSAESLPALLAAASRASGVTLVVVHGGGDEVTRLQRQMGSEPTFLGGRRVTTDSDMEVVRMVLSGTINKRLVRQLLDQGIAAVGISGEDGGLLPVSLLEEGALGAVGDPLDADARVLDALIAGGFVPVVSPLGRHAETGQGLNVNGDDAAAAIAAALHADELLLVADVPAVLDAGGAPIAHVSVDSIDQLISTGVARGGMSAKLEAARRALAGGVSAVRIGDVSALTDPLAGTRVTNVHSPI
jgi:acetylglutamate kinase